MKATARNVKVLWQKEIFKGGIIDVDMDSHSCCSSAFVMYPFRSDLALYTMGQQKLGKSSRRETKKNS
jgi:hypothetical protein